MTGSTEVDGTTYDAGYDVEQIRHAIHNDGVTALKGAFDVAWVDRLAADVAVAFEEALGREGGAVGRGPKRWYVEVHPEAISGFVDLVSHPWVQAVGEAILGPDWTVVEVGFDVPKQGSMNQPWHRDFPSPVETTEHGRLTSLAFNVTTVDTEADMGPFEIAQGTQWDDDPSFKHGMFPPKRLWGRYEERAVKKFPQRGDISARSALTIHRGTANVSPKARPVLVLGVDGPEADNAEHHDLAVTHAYWDALPDEVRQHLSCPVVDELTPITQKHTIEGLEMGEA